MSALVAASPFSGVAKVAFPLPVAISLLSRKLCWIKLGIATQEVTSSQRQRGCQSHGGKREARCEASAIAKVYKTACGAEEKAQKIRGTKTNYAGTAVARGKRFLFGEEIAMISVVNHRYAEVEP